jgi:hypothetical protein
MLLRNALTSLVAATWTNPLLFKIEFEWELTFSKGHVHHGNTYIPHSGLSQLPSVPSF